MNEKVIKKEIEQVELNLREEFKQQADPLKIMDDLHVALLKISNTAVDAANSTTSYDEKITSLLSGLQECVQLVYAQKVALTTASIKYEHQREVIRQIKSKISDLEFVAEKKIEG